jgi:hypothetical protein
VEKVWTGKPAFRGAPEAAGYCSALDAQLMVDLPKFDLSGQMEPIVLTFVNRNLVNGYEGGQAVAP